MDHRESKGLSEKHLLLLQRVFDYAKAFDYVDHNKLWKTLKEMGIPDHLTCLLRNLYVGQEAMVRTGHGTTNWLQIRKRIRKGCILSPCFFNLYAEYIMRNAMLDEAQLKSRFLGELSTTSDMQMILLMAESKEELKSFLMKVKDESEKAGLKLKMKKTEIKAVSPITSWQTNGEKVVAVTDFIFLSSKITADSDCSHEIKRSLVLRRKTLTNLESILKNRDISLPTKVHTIKATVFPGVMYRCESWTIKKAKELMPSNCGAGEDSSDYLGL